MRKAHIGEDVESIRIALVELRRLFQRKELAQLWTAAAMSTGVAPERGPRGGPKRTTGRSASLDYADLRLLDAVRVAESRPVAGEAAGATVGDIARLLGVDPSRASRQVARAVRSGLLRRRASDADGRAVVLEVTPKGAALQARGSELTRARIEVALDAWSAADRERFAELFGRFAAAMVG